MRNILGILRNASELQRRLKEAEKQLAAEKVQHVSADGRMRITASCSLELEKIEIDSDWMQENKSTLEAALVKEINCALRAARRKAADSIPRLAGLAGLMPEDLRP